MRWITWACRRDFILRAPPRSSWRRRWTRIRLWWAAFMTDGNGIIVAEAQVVDVPHLRMSQAVTPRGEMNDLIEVFDSLAWKLTRQLDPGFNVSEDTFVAAGKGMRLDAFEQYIRGITEPDQEERLRHLTRLSR